jgi:poly(3-hydroxybutyrate) depolymerase
MWIALGTADGKARWEGHAGALSGEQTLDFWRRAGGCGPDPAVSWSDAPGDDTRTERRVYKDCTRARVEAVVVHGGGHAWPGSGHRDSTRDVSATDEIVRFFDSL